VLKAKVSIDKLTSFVQAKGIEVEVKGGIFALNIKQQKLNEDGEVNTITEMIGMLHEVLQNSFDYTIQSGEPISTDGNNEIWEIPQTVTVRANKNLDFCTGYLIKTISALSLTDAEVESYRTLNKPIFPVKIVSSIYYLRQKKSVESLRILDRNWYFYTKLFTVNSSIDEKNGLGELQSFFWDDFNTRRYSDEVYEKATSVAFEWQGYWAAETTAIARYEWKDRRSLNEIEKITKYSVKPRGIVSPFKYGGFVIKEENGHALIVSLAKIGEYNTVGTAKYYAEKLVINGYSDWRLPSPEEAQLIINAVKSAGQLPPSFMEQIPAWIDNGWTLRGSEIDETVTDNDNFGRSVMVVRSF
jgi:hypothetical protein